MEDRRVLSVDVVDGQAFLLAENSDDDTVVGTVQATNSDAAEPLTYAITAGNESNAFLINPVSGEIRVRDGAQLDFETKPVWELTVEAQAANDATIRDSAAVTIRLTDVFAPAVVTLTGGMATLGVDQGRLSITQNGAMIWSAPQEDVSALTIVGSSQADNLVVDFSGGELLPSGGLLYDGLDQPVGGLDAIELTGGVFDSLHARYDNANDGGFTLTKAGLTGTIEYRNLEPVTLGVAVADLTITLNGDANNAILQNFTGGRLIISNVGASTFEETNFLPPTNSLTIDLGAGDDTLTITPVIGNFTIDVQGGVGELNSNTLIIDQTGAAPAADRYRFAGFTFDQTATPDQGFKLAAGTYDGAIVTAAPSSQTGTVVFPESPTGFNSALSIGRILNPTILTGTIAQRLPAGDNGTTARSGFQLSWSGGRTLTNEDGDDLVLYESSESAGSGPDAMMIQVLIDDGSVNGVWTRWYYEPTDGRANYTTGPQGAYATSIDLTDLGVAAGDKIKAIRVVNMVAGDRIDGPGFERTPGSGVLVGSGFVIPAPNTTSAAASLPGVLPDPGPNHGFSYFNGRSTQNPEPLYIGALHPLSGATPFANDNDLVQANSSSVVVTTGAATRTINYNDVGKSLQILTRDGSDQIELTLEANLPAGISLNGGSPNQGDQAKLIGVSGEHVVALSGTTATVDGRAITLAGLETLTLDLTAASATPGVFDAVTIDGSFRLSGATPQLIVQGGGTGQTDSLVVNAEAPAVAPVIDAADDFTFAAVTFDQASTPTVLSDLRLGTLDGGDGVVINARPFPANTSSITGFPSAVPPAEFDSSLSLGRLFRPDLAGVRFVNLPDDTTNGLGRAGFALSWTDDRVYQDFPGYDFSIFESGDLNSPEPTMVQVRSAVTGLWSEWRYNPATSQAITQGSARGLVSVYDLADFGADFAAIDAIRFATMTLSDRIDPLDSTMPYERTPGSGIFVASGRVLPGVGGTLLPLPDPGPLVPLSTAQYASGSFDADPFYFGVRGPLANFTAAVDGITIDTNSVEIGGFVGIAHTGLADLTVNAGGGADTINVVDSAAMTAGTPPYRSVTINAGDGNDTINVNTIDTAFRAAVTVDGGTGADVVNFNAALTLGSTAAGRESTGNLLVTAETINLNQAIDTTGGTQGTVTFNVGTAMTIAAAGDITAGDDVLFTGAAVTTAGDITAADAGGGHDITFQQAITLSGSVNFSTALTPITGGNISLQGNVAGTTGGAAETLTLNTGVGSIDVEGLYGVGTTASATGLTAVTITNAGETNFNGPINITGALTQTNAATGATTFFDVVSVGSATLRGTTFDVQDALNATGAVAVTNSDLFTKRATGTIAADGGFSASGAVSLANDILTVDTDITIGGALTLAAPSILLSTGAAAGGNVRLDGADAMVDGDSLLTVTAGTGNVIFDGDIGATTALKGLVVTSAGNLDFNNKVTVKASGLDLTTSGTVGFDDEVKSSAGGAVTIVNGGLLTIAADADFTIDGAFQQTGAAAVDLAGDITTTNDVISFLRGVTLSGDVALNTDTGAGDITFSSTLKSAVGTNQDLTLTAGTGSIAFNGQVGQGDALGDVKVVSALNVGVNAIFSAATFTQDAGTGVTTFGATTALSETTNLALDVHTKEVIVNAGVSSLGGTLLIETDDFALNAGGTLSATAAGTVVVEPLTAGRTINLGTNGVGLALDAPELTRITANVLRIGDGDAGNISISAAIAPAGVTDLHLVTAGGVSATVAGTIAVTGLGIEALDDVNLFNFNDVDRLAVSFGTADNDLAFRDVDGVTLAAVADVISGISNVNGRTTLQVAGTLTQTTVGGIVSDELELLGSGSVVLAGLGIGTNRVGTLAANFNGAISFNNLDPLTIGTAGAFASSTTGITTTNDNVSLFTNGTLSLEGGVDVQTADVVLFVQNGAIGDVGPVQTKIRAATAELVAAQGIGGARALRTEIGTLAAFNGADGGIVIDDRSGTAMTIGVVGPFIAMGGLTNFGAGGVSLTHTGSLAVNAAVQDFGGGGTSLVTQANGGDDDHLTLNALVSEAGGAGNITLTAGTDLLLNDSGFADDVITTGAGSIFGNAGRNIAFAPNVRVTSATGSLVDIPPVLVNVTGPQIAATGDASVSFDFGRFLEQTFTAIVNWADGGIDTVFLPVAGPNSTTVNHVYTGNPNLSDPAAPIPITVTLRNDSRIHFAGFETTTVTITLDFPGDGVRNVRIDTTVKVRLLSGGQAERLVNSSPLANVVVVRSSEYGSGAGVVEAAESTERTVVIREILPDGSIGSEVRLGENALNELTKIFQKLRTGRYVVLLVEPGPGTPRLLMDIYIRDGKPTVPEVEATPDGGADGASIMRGQDAIGSTGGSVGDDFAATQEAELEESDDDDSAAGSSDVRIAATVGVAGLVASGLNGSWTERVEAAFKDFRKYSRLRPRRRRNSRPR